jgi:hypothetical protein
MRKIILILAMLLLVSTVYADCDKNASFVERLTSTCKENNNICDDGEYLLLDEDCKIKWKDHFNDMWLAKLLLIVSLILLLYKSNRDKKILAVFIIALVFINYTPSLKEARFKTTVKNPFLKNTTIIKINNTNATNRDILLNDFKQIGSKVSRNHPLMGFIFLVILLLYFFAYLPNKKNKNVVFPLIFLLLLINIILAIRVGISVGLVTLITSIIIISLIIRKAKGGGK